MSEREYDAQDRLLTYGGATSSYTANGELSTRTIPQTAFSPERLSEV